MRSSFKVGRLSYDFINYVEFLINNFEGVEGICGILSESAQWRDSNISCRSSVEMIAGKGGRDLITQPVKHNDESAQIIQS